MKSQLGVNPVLQQLDLQSFRPLTSRLNREIPTETVTTTPEP